jgi:hypothetical protein
MRDRLRFLLLLIVAAIVSTLLHELGHCVFYWAQGVPAAMSVTKEYPLTDITASQYAIGSAGGPLFSIAAVVLAVSLYRRRREAGPLKGFLSALILTGAFYFILRSLIALLKGRGGELDSAASLLGLDYRAAIVVFVAVIAVSFYLWIRAGGPRFSLKHAGYFVVLLIGYVIFVVALQSIDQSLFWAKFPSVEIGDGRVYNAHPS